MFFFWFSSEQLIWEPHGSGSTHPLYCVTLCVIWSKNSLKEREVKVLKVLLKKHLHLQTCCIFAKVEVDMRILIEYLLKGW